MLFGDARRERHVVCMRERCVEYRADNLKAQGHLSVGRRLQSRLRVWPVVGYEHRNGLQSFTKHREFVD